MIKRVRGGRIRGVLALMQVTGDKVLGTVVPIVARRGRTVGYAGSHFSAPADASAYLLIVLAASLLGLKNLSSLF